MPSSKAGCPVASALRPCVTRRPNGHSSSSDLGCRQIDSHLVTIKTARTAHPSVCRRGRSRNRRESVLSTSDSQKVTFFDTTTFQRQEREFSPRRRRPELRRLLAPETERRQAHIKKARQWRAESPSLQTSAKTGTAWWRKQSDPNPSLVANSLLTGKRTGKFVESALLTQY